jgi:biopolymer transport protein ExbB
MITNSLLQIIREGGYVFMIPLIVLSILSLAVILERIFVFSKRVLLPSVVIGKIEKAVKENKKEEITSILKNENSFAAHILQEALKIFQGKEETMSLEKAFSDTMEKHVEWLTGRLWMLRAIGHIAPLLGLLGTVVGLSISFSKISQVGLSQQTVAGGISIALITTITGLGIALPTLFADYCLRAWAQRNFTKIKTMLYDFVVWYG